MCSIDGGDTITAMGRIEDRLFRIADEVQTLRTEREQVAAELEYHRHIAEDAERDAVVSGSNMDRLEAGATSKDVERFERRLRQIEGKLGRLDEKRQSLLSKLDR